MKKKALYLKCLFLCPMRIAVEGLISEWVITNKGNIVYHVYENEVIT